MKMPRPNTIDFETEGIEGRPKYPPKPVGVSIKLWGKRPRYYSWGHPTENTSTKAEATKALRAAWKNPDGILCHNTKFDADVAETHMGMKRLPWAKMHDSVHLLFLHNPHSPDFSLKPSAEVILGLPPEERDAVMDWLMKHQPLKQQGIKISKSKKSPHYWGAYICLAPGRLVAKYANGDTTRAEGIFKNLWNDVINKRKMLEPYQREQELMPILLDEMERPGIRVHVNRLRRDIKSFEKFNLELERWIYKRIGIDASVNIDSGKQLVPALIAADKIDETKLGVTPTGLPKSSKDALAAAMTDSVLLAVLKYRTQLGTCLNTFMKNWLLTAEESGGLIYTWWNQTKSYAGGGAVGARTGRLSSRPSFMNIPNVFGEIFRADDPKNKDLPIAPKLKLPWRRLPHVRSYIVPWDKSEVLIDRDYSQQELRGLGHFEGGVLAQAYADDPWLDVHEHARQLINRMLGRNFKRKPIKNTGFGLIYGMGLGLLAQKSNITIDVAKEVKDAYLAIFPGLKAMYTEMKMRAENNMPIRTWGGREYYCEEPKIVKGRGLMKFDYKMVNVLIQGSAADCTKQAIINYSKIKTPGHRMYLTVHDEILCSVPKADIGKAMSEMRTAMEDVDFSVPMLSEGTLSSVNWAKLKDYDVKGELV